MMLPTAVFAIDETGEEDAEAAPMIETELEVPEEPEAAEELPEEEEEPEFTEEEDIILDEEEPQEVTTEPAYLENITIEENPMGTVVIRWDAFEGAAHYETASPGLNDGEAVVTEKPKCTVSGLKHGADYDFTVAACDENGDIIARGAVSITTEPYRIRFNDASHRNISSRTIKPKKFSINLRKMIGESNGGYAVVQGGCTDGKYAYYLMVSTATQHGRVLKVRMRDNKVVKRSKVLNTWHGNGMAYDSTRKKLVVIAREHRKQEITLIDAKTLKITKQKNASYTYKIDTGSAKLNKIHNQSGLAAIAYVKKYDCYVALERVYHNLLIFDPDTFECIGMVYTVLGSSNPGTFQAMDADAKYVYLLLSYYNEDGKVQPYNKIVVLDWNSENLLPVVNACKSKDPLFVKKAWYCNNKGNGKPSATIRLKTKYEVENIYHTSKNGKEHFYLSEYYGHYAYKKSGRGRYYKRDNFVYDLGII